MTDELTVDGKQYVSSKRASEISRYAQDYVGQLARAGLIDAQRIGGLWYVFMESLLKYKEKADSYVPKPPQQVYNSNVPDAVVSFDGKDYVSASRAAEITGYHQDYVGQLARAGKVLSRQVGNRWYVDREGVLAHKDEKDALLGAVQSQSVGIRENTATNDPYERKIEEIEPLSYSSDSGVLMPVLTEVGSYEELGEDVHEEPADEATVLPIRVVDSRQRVRNVTYKSSHREPSRIVRPPRKTMSYAIILTLAVVVTVVTFITISIYFQRQVENVPRNNEPISYSHKVGKLSLRNLAESIGGLLEPYIARELIYRK